MSGIVNHADWNLVWNLPMSGSEAGGGLQIMCASFQNRPVLLRGSLPFLLVPYHTGGNHFKDGLQHIGAPFTPVKPTAPNRGSWGLPPGSLAVVDTDAVVVEKLAATTIEPAKAVVWAKLQCANYQYIHRWEFNADGRIEVGGAMGGPTISNAKDISHVHNFYFRLDFAIGSGGNQVVERQVHAGTADSWVPFTNEGKSTFTASEYTRWRVRHNVDKNKNGQPISYEIVPGTVDPPDGTYSTADLFIVRKKGFSDELGHAVGITDAVLETTYGSGLPIAGQDVILWYVMREHHRVAALGEDKDSVVYHGSSFTIRPRDFLDATPTGLYATLPVSPP